MNKMSKNNYFRKTISIVIIFIMIFQFGASSFALGDTTNNTFRIINPVNLEEDGEVSSDIDVDSLKDIIDMDIKPTTESSMEKNEPENIPTDSDSSVNSEDLEIKQENFNEGMPAFIKETPIINNTTLASRVGVPSTFNITWLEGGLNTVRQEGKITGDQRQYLDIDPFDNETTRPAIYQLNFTMGGDRDALPGEVRIKIPKHIFYGRDGQSVDIQKLPVLKAPETGGATNFHYVEGTGDNKDYIILTNYEPFLRTESLTVAIEHDFWPSDVKNGYENLNIQASVEIAQDTGINPIIANSNTIEVKVHTHAKLVSIDKYSKSRYDEWQNAWGVKPADADEYFYNMWELSLKKPQNNTQPYEVKYVDTPDPVGEIVAFSNTRVHWVPAAPSSWTLNQKNADGTDIFSNKVFYSETKPNNRTYDTRIVTYIITRYKKDLGVDGRKFRNDVVANLTGIDDAKDTKKSYATFTYKPPAEYSGDNFSNTKKTDGNMIKYGLLTALENGASIKPTGLNNYTFGIVGNSGGMKSLADNGGYSVEIEDNIMGLRQYDLNGVPKTPWFEILQPDVDFKYTNFYLEYKEFNSEYNINSGYTRVEAKDYENYKPVELHIQKGTNEWIKLGEFTRNFNGSYKYTDKNGMVTNYIERNRQVPLPEGTTNIKLVYKSEKFAFNIEGRFGIEIIPTEKVKAAIKRARDANETILNFYNFSTMAVKNKDGRVVKQNDEIMNSYAKKISEDNPDVRTALLAQAKEMGADDGKYLENGETYLDMRDLVVSDRLTKTSKSTTSDVNNGREIINYEIQMAESTTQNRAVIPEQLAEEWKLVSEQNSGVFYDLLPKGTWALRDTIKVYTMYYYSDGYGPAPTRGELCSHSVEFFPDWKNSGMTMMKVTAKAPMEHNIKTMNMSGNSYFRYSGFVMEFSVANTWDNILDTGRTMLNSVAYETGAERLYNGYTDINSATKIEEKDWFEDVNGNNDPDTNKFLFAQHKMNINPIIATEIGFTKKVKAVDEPTFGTLSEVPLSGEYVYRLRFAVNKNTQSKNVVIYDVLENAFGDNKHWQGTFNRVDASAAKERNIQPVIYYSTRNDLNPRENYADGDLTNPAIWTTTEPEDKTTIKVVAVDLSKNTAGNPYIFPAESVIPIYIYMHAPKEAGAVTNQTIYAYNDSFIRGINVVGTGVNVELNEKSEIVRVHIKDIAMDIKKTSNPESGTFENPTDISTNGNKLVYNLRITDKSTKDVARNVVVEDILPDGLVIDEGVGISFAFGRNGDSGKITEAKTIKFVQDGQKLTFTIEKLYEENHLDLTIPVKVDPTKIPGNYTPKFQNQGIIKSVSGREYDIASEFTYHKSILPVNILAKKVWDGDNPNRPTSATIELQANGVKVGDPVTLNATNDWKNRWENLPYADDNGNPIVYSVKEDAISDYVTVVEEELDLETSDKVFKVINKFVSTSRNVTKIWDDDNNSREKRPESVTVQLMQDGRDFGNPVELNEENNWKHTWNNLPQIISGTTYHEYSIKEFPVEGYETIIKEDVDDVTNGLSFEITNRYKTTSRYVKKQWDDRGNVLELRPNSVVVRLLANGVSVGDPITLNAENNWQYEWKDLEIMEGEHEIEYTITEDFVNHYEHKIEEVFAEESPQPEEPALPGEGEELENPTDNGNTEVVPKKKVEGYILTNVLQFTERTVLKIWDDDDDKLGKQPESVTVQLYQDGVPYGEPVELSKENDWHYNWNYLSATNGQVFHDYTIEEVPIEGYKVDIETIFIGEEDTEENERAYIITNSIIKPEPEEPEDKISVTGRKIWIGGPNSKPMITFQLFRNGEPYGNPVDLLEGTLSYVWNDLESKDIDGRLYEYSVREINIPYNYTAQTLNNNTTIVNTWNGFIDPTYPVTPWDPPLIPVTPVYPVEPVPPIIKPNPPAEPDRPVEPDKPVEPSEKPADFQPENPTIIPKTGDDSLMLVYGAVLVIALAILGRMFYKRSKGK